jgi:3-oxoisoapionate decarboxylase
MTMDDFLDFAKELGVDGVSLESCFFPSFDREYLADLKAKLDQYGFDRVYAWGHPDGLERGQKPSVRRHGAQHRPRGRHRRRRHARRRLQLHLAQGAPRRRRWALIEQFRRAVPLAERPGVKLAVENHIDFTGDEMVQLIEGVGSPNFGINFDTGNFLRLLDDPIKGMQKLAPYTFATHIKDLKINPDAAPDDWYFFSSVPVGDGLIDNVALARMLKDANYGGFLAVETDFLHPDYGNDEHAAIRKSVAGLRRIVEEIG